MKTEKAALVMKARAVPHSVLGAQVAIQPPRPPRRLVKRKMRK